MVFIQPPISFRLIAASKRFSRSDVICAPSELDPNSAANSTDPAETARLILPSTVDKSLQYIIYLPLLWGKGVPIQLKLSWPAHAGHPGDDGLSRPTNCTDSDF